MSDYHNQRSHDGLMEHLAIAKGCLYFLACHVRACVALDPAFERHERGQRAAVMANCDDVRNRLRRAMFAAECYRAISPPNTEADLPGSFEHCIEQLRRIDAAILEIRRSVEPKRFRRRDRCARVCWAFVDIFIELSGVDEELEACVNCFHDEGIPTPLGAYKNWEELRKAAGEHAPEMPAELLDAMSQTAFPFFRGLDGIFIARAARTIQAANQRFREAQEAGTAQHTEPSGAAPEARPPLRQLNGTHVKAPAAQEASVS